MGYNLKKPIWVSVDERLPDMGYMCHLKYIYRNGNSGTALGYYDNENKEWIIEHSDDHPNSEDIKYWLDEIIF